MKINRSKRLLFTYTPLMACLVCITIGLEHRGFAQGLTVLQNYEGTWDCKFSINPVDGGEGQASDFTGVVYGKWILGNKFLEQTGSYKLDESSQPLIIKTIMSFDENKNRFQYDYYNSTGDIQRSFGRWDASRKTMTSILIDEPTGNTTTIVADFSTPNIEKWSIETRDKDNNATMLVTGTNTKRKQR